MNAVFPDHFSAVAAQYANARPDYPPALFDWIASVVPARALAWEPGCGSGQATRDLATVFARVHATDPSAAQIAQARGPSNATFAVEPGERCALPGASADAICIAQALHWLDLPRFFAECDRVLKPGGLLIAWGYQDIIAPEAIAGPVYAFQQDVAPYWPPERRFVDEGYASFDFPFARTDAPTFALAAEWTLPRLLGYFSSYSATKRFIDAHGRDPVAAHAAAIESAWGDPQATRTLRWPLFLHARRKEA